MRDALAKAITANLDFNGDNQVVGVEILNLSKRVSKPDLSEFQFQSAWIKESQPYSLSYDHRVIDDDAGAEFTRFLGTVLTDIRQLIV